MSKQSKSKLDAALSAAWKTIRAKKADKGKEVADRNGVENIIQKAFGRKGVDQLWRRYMDLVLPDNPDVINADSITVMELPDPWKKRLERFDRSFTFSWSYSNIPQSIVTFIFIQNDDDSVVAGRYLTMCLYAAQMHRRALCCEDGEVFGATFHRGTLLFYVAFWNEEQLAIRTVLRPYDLKRFTEFVECYAVLCRLADMQAEHLRKEFDRWDAEMESHIKKLEGSVENPWRKEKQGEIESDAGEGNEEQE